MSLESARAVYPILVQLARDLSQAARDRRTAVWVSYDDFCQRCKDVGIKETPRTIATKLLKPLQTACLEKNLPDLSALIIQKPKARSDFGNLLRPSDGWWEPYVTRGETDRRRRRVLVQAVPGRPRLRRLARGPVLLNAERPGQRRGSSRRRHDALRHSHRRTLSRTIGNCLRTDRGDFPNKKLNSRCAAVAGRDEVISWPFDSIN